MKAVRLGWVALGCALTALLSCGAAAQVQSAAAGSRQEPSLGEIARKLRAEKKPAAKTIRIYTNDNLPTGPGLPVSVVGAPAPGEAPAPAPAAAPGPPSAQEKERAETTEALQQEKQRLARAKRELELLQRDYDLMRQQVFSNPSPDPAARAAYDRLGQQVEAKRQEVQQAEQKIGALGDQVESLSRQIGPQEEKALSADEQRAAWVARIQPLRAELAQVEAEISRIRAEAARQGFAVAGAAASGSMVAQMLQNLESRRSEIQRKIAQIEDEAQRAGIPAAWIR